MMLPDKKIEQKLSESYLRAIAAMAGCTVKIPEDDFGIDYSIHGIRMNNGRVSEDGTSVDVQLKSTTDYREEDDSFAYQIENKNFNDLVLGDTLAPRILVVLFMPRPKVEWTNQTVNELMIRKCAYWAWLRGQPPKEKLDSKTTIKLSKRRVFSSDALRSIMSAIKTNGGDLSAL
jgi:hypothetical protein